MQVVIVSSKQAGLCYRHYSEFGGALTKPIDATFCGKAVFIFTGKYIQKCNQGTAGDHRDFFRAA